MKHPSHLLLLLPLGLAACASTPPAPQVFPPLNYSYLPPITLKVASVTVEDDYMPGPAAAQLIAQAPEAPATALQSMARTRLVADGSPGSAMFVIKNASLHQAGNMLDGAMDVELDISTSNGQRVAFAEASVSRSVTLPSDSDEAHLRAALYDLTKSLMTEMNVQFQYQVQKSLPEWLAYPPNAGFGAAGMTAPGLAPAASPPPIQAQPLTAPAAPPSFLAPPPELAPPSPQ